MDNRFAMAGVAALSAGSLSAEQAIGNSYRFFDVPCNGTDNYADGEGFCCNLRAIINYNTSMTIMGNGINPNELKISKEEFKALTKCSSEVRYQYALKRIADTETMWSIIEDTESFAIQSYGNERFLLIWSSKEYAQAFCVNNWSSCKCIAITLDAFEKSIIDFICEEKLLINVFPTQQEVFGKIVGLNSFAKDLSEALEDYK